MSDNFYVPVHPAMEDSSSGYPYQGDPRQGAPVSMPRMLFYTFLFLASIAAILALVFSSILWGRQSNSNGSGGPPSFMPRSTTLQIVDASSTVVPDANFDIPLQCLTANNYEVVLQFPLFNFQIPSGGGTLKVLSSSALSLACSPNQLTTLSLSTNDGGITSVTDFNLPAASFLPIAAFEIVIKVDGSLVISLPGGVLIPAGGHTINSQTVSYFSTKSSGPPTEAVTASIHTFTLQYLDGGLWPLTQLPTFPLAVSVEQSTSHIRLSLPVISFTITSAISPLNLYQFDINGQGGVRTQSGALPKSLCPGQIQTVTQVTPDGLGISVSIDTYGKLWITASNVIYMVLPAGNYTFDAQDIVYARKVEDGLDQLINNRILQSDSTNIVGFTESKAQAFSLADGQNDFYDGLVVYSFSSNGLQTDQTNNAMDIFAAVGTVQTDGTVEFVNGSPTRIFTATSNLTGIEPTIAISRTDLDVIVVTFTLMNFNVVPNTGSTPGATGSTNTFMSCVTIDGGLTWSTPTPILPSVTTGFESDIGGVVADQYGNFIYSVVYSKIPSAFESQTVQVLISADNAQTWISNNAWQSTNGDGDFSHSSFFFYSGAFAVAVGPDGTGRYGLWAVGSAYIDQAFDGVPWIIFLPITGLGSAGSLQQMTPTGYMNLAAGISTTIAISDQGRVFSNNWAISSDATNYGPQVLLQKAPGAFLTTLVEPPQTIYNSGMVVLSTTSQPNNGGGQGENGLLNANGLVYDNLRGVLYSASNEQPDVTSQDFYYTLVVSFDMGVTFSRRLSISSSHLYNRGDSTMAFDPVQGGLSFAWHDGRNDPTMQSTQYFYDVWSPCHVDTVVRTLAIEMGITPPAPIGVSC